MFARVLFCAAAAALLPFMAFAGPNPRNDFETCATATGDVVIAACNRAIASRKFRGRDLATLYNNRGSAWYDKGDYDRAIADYAEAIRLNPKYALAFNNRGNAWAAKGDYDRAIADYTEAIRLDPKGALAYNNRGNAWHDKGDHDRAIADLTEAIRLNPKHALIYDNRGNAWHDKGDHDRAIADYTEAIRLDPKFASAYNRRCWARATANRDLQQALADCNESLQLRPRDADTLDSRGFVYLRLGHLDNAIADYDAALEVDPKKASSFYGRGIAKLRKGEADIAAATAIRADIAAGFARYGVTAGGASSPAATDCSAAETHWKSALTLDIRAAYEDHLKRFTSCPFAGLAKARLESLNK
jgi:tetratricopeptide (TPR) repeat protein